MQRTFQKYLINQYFKEKKISNQAQSCYIRLFTLCDERRAPDKCVIPAITFRRSCTIDAL